MSLALSEQTQSPDPLTFLIWCIGTPIPQGSKVARVQGKRAIIWDSNAEKLKPWRALVSGYARDAFHGRDPLLGALVVTLDFYMPRGVTVKRARPSVKPDADKLARSVLDSLTDALVWEDDSQVVTLTARLWYADERPPGVRIQVGPAA